MVLVSRTPTRPSGSVTISQSSPALASGGLPSSVGRYSSIGGSSTGSDSSGTGTTVPSSSQTTGNGSPQ